MYDQIANISTTGQPVDILETSQEQIRCEIYFFFIMHSLVAGILCILGLLGNSLSFVALGQDNESPVASFSLRAIAVVDNFFLMIWFCHFSIRGVLDYYDISQNLDTFWIYLQMYTYSLVFVGQTATIWMTVLIAVSRFIAVCLPYRASQWVNLPKMKIGVSAVIICSVIYNVPRCFETTLKSSNGTYTFQRTAFGNSVFYSFVYFDIFYYIFSFILPLLLLSVLNTKLILAYRVVQKRRCSLRRRNTHQSENNITLVMIIVVVVFMVCNAPAKVVQLVLSYEVQVCPGFHIIFTAICNVLEVLNSSTNFIIYCVFRRQFRDTLKTWIPCTHDKCNVEEETTVNTPLDKPGKNGLGNSATVVDHV